VLVAPDLDKKMRMEVDALDYAIGEVIYRMQKWKMETGCFSLKIPQ